MNLFDILGPVMVGPSSSHTAGAVRIGYITRKILGQTPEDITILLHGSFADTGKGHGTDKALVAGLLGMLPDNVQIPESYKIAAEQGIHIQESTIFIQGAHPNTVRLKVRAGEEFLEITASSLGGGKIQINNINGIETSFSGDSPTLIVNNYDRPGCVADVTSLLAKNAVNIATMQLYRQNRGGFAVMVVETDQQIPQKCIGDIKKLEGVFNVIFIETII